MCQTTGGGKVRCGVAMQWGSCLWRRLALAALWTTALAALPAPVARAEETPDSAAAATQKSAAESEAARNERVWRRYWAPLARHYLHFDGEYLCFEKWNPRFPSSLGITVEQAQAKLNAGVAPPGPGATGPSPTPPRAEAEAMAMALPNLAVGEYGYIHSVRIDRVLSPTEMIVSNLWLVDTEAAFRNAREDVRDQLLDTRRRERLHEQMIDAQRQVEAQYSQRAALARLQQEAVFSFRPMLLVGAPTGGLVAGKRYTGRSGTGLQVAVIGTTDERKTHYGYYASKGGGKQGNYLVLTPTDILKTTIKENQFVEMLGQRGLDKAGFVELVLGEVKNGEQNLDQRVVLALEAKAPIPAPSGGSEQAPLRTNQENRNREQQRDTPRRDHRRNP